MTKLQATTQALHILLLMKADKQLERDCADQDEFSLAMDIQAHDPFQNDGQGQGLSPLTGLRLI